MDKRQKIKKLGYSVVAVIAAVGVMIFTYLACMHIVEYEEPGPNAAWNPKNELYPIPVVLDFIQAAVCSAVSIWSFMKVRKLKNATN